MSATSAQREDWVDAAKGIAICLVVLFHSSMFLELVDLAGLWPKIVALLDTFRMPLFFFTVGLFARKAIQHPFPELWSKRVAKLLWLYGLWTLMWILAFRPLVGKVAKAEVKDINPLLEWVLSFVLPNESTWFLWALAVFFVVSWSMRMLPSYLQIALAAALAVIASADILPITLSPLEKSVENFVFFVTAVHLSTRVRAAASRTSLAALLIAATAYVVVLLPVAKFDLTSIPGVKVLLGALGVIFGISIAVLLVRAGWGGGLSALGKRTLPIYLVHFYVAAGAAAVAAYGDLLPGWSGLLLVPGVTAVSIVMSLLIHRWLRRVPGLWDLPRLRIPSRS